MGITLRTNKGIALTYNEMDKNYSSFFFSASKEGSNTLRLWYTGSISLGGGFEPSRYIDINLNAGEGNIQLVPGGTAGAVQFNQNGNTLGGNASDFYYDSASIRLGLSTSNPSASLHITNKDANSPATIRLEGQAGGNNGKRAYAEFFRGTLYGTIGLSTDSTDIYQNTQTGNRFQIAGQDKMHITSSGVGIYLNTANYAEPNQTLTVVGTIGVGSTTTDNNQAVIKELGGTEEIATNVRPVAAGTGLLIGAQKNKGSVLIGLTTDSNQNEAFAVVRRAVGTTYVARVATIRANGDTELSGSLTIKNTTINTANNGSAVIITPTGTVYKIDAAPVPKGGIIMWSGAIAQIPDGWQICDGTNGTPDLRSRFVIGAGSTYETGSTGGSADAVVVSHSHTGTTAPVELRGTVTGVSETFNLAASTSGVFTKTLGFPAAGTPSSIDTSNAGQLNFNGDHQHQFTTNQVGESGTGKNLPPYFALAFIMYKGI